MFPSTMYRCPMRTNAIVPAGEAPAGQGEPGMPAVQENRLLTRVPYHTERPSFTPQTMN